MQAASQESDSATICADQQEKDGNVYKLHGHAEVHYRNYVLRADEITYDSDSGEATASGHFSLDGGPNDDHLRASHGNYNLTAETGRFYDVSATTGLRFSGKRAVLTSSAPFAFSGKLVEKTSPDHYLVYDGTITTCELPRPNWQFQAHKVVVDVGGNASIYRSKFMLHGFPVFYFPYATHPVAREVRSTGFLVPTIGRSSTKGNIVGDSFYWAINRSMDALVGAEYFSLRGWSQRGEFRMRPSDTSYVDLNFFGVNDRGIGTPPLQEGGQEARLTAEGNFYGFRAVSNVDYLSSFLFRLAFNEVYTQAINSEVKSQLFVSKAVNGFSFGGMVERYQNFFQTTNAEGALSNPPTFDSIRILHTPSVDASSVDRALGHSPFFWSFDVSAAGLSRSEPGFHTSSLLGRFDFNPEISLPLQVRGWALRPALTLHETYYTERFVNGNAVPDPTNRQALEGSVELRPPVLEKIFDKEFLGKKWKHVIEPRIVYRYVTGVNDFAQVLHFDEHDILSDTHEVQYGFVTRLYSKGAMSHIQECDVPMTGLAVGAAAPEQTVPWQRLNNLDTAACNPGPETKEVVSWEIYAKVFSRLDLRRSARPRTAQCIHDDGRLDGNCIRHRTAAPFPTSFATAGGDQQPHQYGVGHRLRLPVKPGECQHAAPQLQRGVVHDWRRRCISADSTARYDSSDSQRRNLFRFDCDHTAGLQVQSVSSRFGLWRPGPSGVQRRQQLWIRRGSTAIAVCYRAGHL